MTIRSTVVYICARLLKRTQVWSLNAVLLFSLLTSASAQTLGEWRMTNGNAAQSRYIAGEMKPPFRVQWTRRVPLGAGASIDDAQIVAYGPTLYLVNASHVVAIEAETGKIRWKQASPNERSIRSYDDSPAHFVAMSDGVIVTSDSPALVKRSVQDGSIVWKQNVGLSLGCVLLQSGHLLATAFDFSAESFPLFELDAGTGEILTKRVITASSLPDPYNPIYARWFGQIPDAQGWLFVGGGHALTTLESVSGRLHGLRYNSGVTAALPDRLFVYQMDTLWAMRPNTDLLWHTYVRPTPALLPPPTLVATPSTILVDDLQSIMAFDAHNGHKLWSRTIGDAVDEPRPPIAVGNNLFVLSSQKKTLHGKTRTTHALTALNIRDGKTLWAVPLATAPSWLCVHQGAIYIQSMISSTSPMNLLEITKLVPLRKNR
jgi:outer membrane protein assembly factor BamB